MEVWVALAMREYDKVKDVLQDDEPVIRSAIFKRYS